MIYRRINYVNLPLPTVVILVGGVGKIPSVYSHQFLDRPSGGGAAGDLHQRHSFCIR